MGKSCPDWLGIGDILDFADSSADNPVCEPTDPADNTVWATPLQGIQTTV